MATTVFEGSSADNIELAKQFWKAIDPVSDIQSSLEHLNISQKLNTAPEPKLNITYAHNLPPEDKVTDKHLERGQQEDEEEKLQARKEILRRRKKALDRLHRRIKERQQLEEKSINNVGNTKTLPTNDDNPLNESDLSEINIAMNEIRHFEEEHDLIDEFNDDLSDY